MRALDARLLIAAELRAVALDTSTAHSMAEGRALASLAAAVEGHAAARAGVAFDRSEVEARTAAALNTLARAVQSGP